MRKKAASKTTDPAVATATATATGGPVGPRPRLHKLRVSNFRCIGTVPVEVELDDIVVLVGANNTGKSSILRAYEVVMLHGSKGGELTLEDFPNGAWSESSPPTVELHTVVYEKTAPGERWIETDPTSGEMFVRECWTWSQDGKPKKVGWNVEAGKWHPSEGPWGFANVANNNRPEPHRVKAFASPETQAEEVTLLLKKAIDDRIKDFGKKRAGGGAPSDYDLLVESIKKLRLAIAGDASAAIKDVEDELARLLGEVFPGYACVVDPRPEDDIEKINIYPAKPVLKMGPKDGHKSGIEREGSGASRTLIWTALKILADRRRKSDASERPSRLLMDEPELCLHPNAVRDACRVLYDLPGTKNWQVMITTHSPVFIDLARDNTSIVRVERAALGAVSGTTVFRASRAKLDPDDKIELKLLNLCDPYVAEFFFGGKTIVVEGDTEYTAFKYIMSLEPAKYAGIHVVRARGKACVKALCKILNQFEKSYAVLHDADCEFVVTKKGKQIRNSMWTENESILNTTEAGRRDGRVRLLAAIPDFERAFLGTETDDEKPYEAWRRLRDDEGSRATVRHLLEALSDAGTVPPKGALAWTALGELATAVTNWQSYQT